MRYGIYLLPAIATLANLACGFYSIVMSFEERFGAAAWLILVAIGLDMIDGQIARLTKTNSYFGVELDSLADTISFAMAPALLMYSLTLNTDGKIGIFIALFFVICGVIRLARYNVFAWTKGEMVYFIGLPIPAAAGILASYVVLYEMFYQNITRKTIALLMQRVPLIFGTIPIVMLILSLLMVSSLRYTKFKKLKLARQKSLRILLVVIGMLFLIYAYPQNMIFIVLLAYVLSGIGEFVWRVYRFRQKGVVKEEIKETGK